MAGPAKEYAPPLAQRGRNRGTWQDRLKNMLRLSRVAAGTPRRSRISGAVGRMQGVYLQETSGKQRDQRIGKLVRSVFAVPLHINLCDPDKAACYEACRIASLLRFEFAQKTAAFVHGFINAVIEEMRDVVLDQKVDKIGVICEISAVIPAEDFHTAGIQGRIPRIEFIFRKMLCRHITVVVLKNADDYVFLRLVQAVEGLAGNTCAAAELADGDLVIGFFLHESEKGVRDLILGGQGSLVCSAI